MAWFCRARRWQGGLPDGDAVDAFGAKLVIRGAPSLVGAIDSLHNAEHVALKLRHGSFAHTGGFERVQSRSEVAIKHIICSVSLSYITNDCELAALPSTAYPAALGYQAPGVKAYHLDRFAFAGGRVESSDVSVVHASREVDDIVIFRTDQRPKLPVTVIPGG